MPALATYTACMQYTLRDIPPEIDAELRRRAHDERKSLNTLAIELLQRALELEGTTKRRSVRHLVAKGKWRDQEFDAAMKHFSQVDADLWK